MYPAGIATTGEQLIMGSISKEDVLQRLDMRAFYKTELRLKKHAGKKEVTILCPFHDDHSPSFSVNLVTGLWTCHAGCGGGNVIDFVMKHKNISFYEALQELATRAGMTAEDTQDRQTREIIRSYPLGRCPRPQAWKHRWSSGEKFSWSKDQAGTQQDKAMCAPLSTT